MSDFLTYLFWPNPGGASYTSPKALGLLIVCVALVLLSFGLRRWRARVSNAVTKKLSASWPSAALWFGLIGALLVISRVESIQFLAMRILWFVWGALLLAYALFQAWKFRSRHYEVLPTQYTEDPLSKYLPTKRKR